MHMKRIGPEGTDHDIHRVRAGPTFFSFSWTSHVHLALAHLRRVAYFQTPTNPIKTQLRSIHAYTPKNKKQGNRAGDYLTILLPFLIPAPVSAPPPQWRRPTSRTHCVNLASTLRQSFLCADPRKRTRTSQEATQSAPSLTSLPKTWMQRPASAALSSQRNVWVHWPARKEGRVVRRKAVRRKGKYKQKNKSADRESKLIMLRPYPAGWFARGAFERERDGDFVGGEEEEQSQRQQRWYARGVRTAGPGSSVVSTGVP
ncbi:hypothetical protein IWX90DRAFT_120644 [Phyllosticta citrichinensis]|uniref:Uncharacterized protein n=1 Tax=Phyllosticta citrichinensis TaxID=1130410 RepID=A0ABR1Y3N3_9PEZI